MIIAAFQAGSDEAEEGSLQGEGKITDTFKVESSTLYRFEHGGGE